MNRTTSLRAEEARRAAQSATLKAKQAQSEMFKERAAAMAAEAQKIGNLRALRLAREAEARESAAAAASAAEEARLQEVKAARGRRRAGTHTATKGDAAPASVGTEDMKNQGDMDSQS